MTQAPKDSGVYCKCMDGPYQHPPSYHRQPKDSVDAELATEFVKQFVMDYDGSIRKTQVFDHYTRELKALLVKAKREARDEVVLEMIEQLDMANVPIEVRVPELVSDGDLSRVQVPIIDGKYWVNIHKALKHIREVTLAELESELNTNEGIK